MRFAHHEGRMSLHTYGYTIGGAKGHCKFLVSGLLPATSRSQAISVLRSTGCEVHLLTCRLTEAQQKAWNYESATGPIDANRAKEILRRASEPDP